MTSWPEEEANCLYVPYQAGCWRVRGLCSPHTIRVKYCQPHLKKKAGQVSPLLANLRVQVPLGVLAWSSSCMCSPTARGHCLALAKRAVGGSQNSFMAWGSVLPNSCTFRHWQLITMFPRDGQQVQALLWDSLRKS